MFNVNKSKNILEDLLKNFDPFQYEITRNHIDGSVSLLSPYITHGIFTLPEIYQFVNSNFNLKSDNKFLKELAWREFFYHVWKFKKNQIFKAIQKDFKTEKYITTELPADIINASTGLNLIDNIVKQLYEHGYLHNHARMWLASYIVHFRKIDWRLGADWLYSHLLDGDLASNHLSWQWIAGSFSKKPYLFNAENVSKYGPKNWNCDDTFLDDSYQNLHEFAVSSKKVDGGIYLQEIEPKLYCYPPENLLTATSENLKQVRIIHPWNIRIGLCEKKNINKNVGVFFEEFHTKWPWSKKRWSFVMDNMKSICDEIYWCEKSLIINGSCFEENLHLDFVLENKSNKLFTEMRPNIWSTDINYCQSFSKFWKTVNKKTNNQYKLFF